ncbi:hypothetical protein SISNIDRAFT_485200 [Sistotremastrum niveocremeum HHB9708]|uniref:Uncharacterized protein n=1 Tax=Sistotremastrum niveocremeum HHB9708 TaxID=1314777 RepID=A0A164VMD1_9AGAM|nr:hypothetical protein SISNIDRAFT_485200 [Sistotremastrum niveocremeum HHB9708]
MSISSGRDNFVRLSDELCYVIPGSVVDFHNCTNVSGSQEELLAALNSLCAFSLSETESSLERLLFGHHSAVQERVQRPSTICSTAATSHLLLSQSQIPTPISLLIWDSPSAQELRLPAFQGCTDVLRVLSCRPLSDVYSSASWITHLVVRTLSNIRTFDPHVIVLNVAFACTTMQACVCMAVKGGMTLRENQDALSMFIDKRLEVTWRKHGKHLYFTNQSLISNIKSSHINECFQWTTVPSALSQLGPHKN